MVIVSVIFLFHCSCYSCLSVALGPDKYSRQTFKLMLHGYMVLKLGKKLQAMELYKI